MNRYIGAARRLLTPLRAVGTVTAAINVPRDGHQSLSYNQASNRLTTAGFEYDAAGNQARIKRADGVWQRMSYDAANRLVEVKSDANTFVYESYRYGVGNQRVASEAGGLRTYYAGGGQASVEYTQAVGGGGGVLTWSKTYIYAGGSVLATIAPAGTSEYVEYHHPDRLGTRLITNNQNTSVQEQESLPYGAALSSGSSTRQFTSYDRSNATGLDYAVNRRYDSLQGRFTQVDPIGIKASNLQDPQSFNLYSYCGNDPVNHTDPDGLFFKKLFKGIGKLFKAVGKVSSAIGKAIATVLNNKWVRIGVFIASFFIPFLGPALAKIVNTALNIYNTVADIAASLQLTGLLYQGKFKELGVNLAVGIASSAVSFLADSAMQGAIEAFRGKLAQFKFPTINDILGGAFSGFKQGVKTLFGQGFKNLLPFYGRYCSPALSGDRGSPVDGIDEQCQIHDGRYRSRNNSDRLRADLSLIEGLFRARSRVRIGDVVFAGRPSGGNVFRFLAIPAFSSIAAYRFATGARP